MRILQVANGFPHRAYGGVELHTYQLCAALGRRGHDVSVFTRRSDLELADATVVDERVDGIPVRSVVNDFKGQDFVHHYLSPEIREIFARTLAELRPDVVHFQHLIGLSADLPAVVRASGARAVATVHEYWYVCQRAMFQFADGGRCGGPAHASCVACVVGTAGRPPAPRWTERAAAALRRLAGGVPALGPEANRDRFRTLRDALRQYERISTPSRFVIEELRRQGMPIDAAMAIPLGVETSAFPEPTAAPALPVGSERPLRLGFVGQHLAHKGPHTLLEAMRLVPELPLRADFHGLRWPDHPYDVLLTPLFAAEPRAAFHGRFPDGALPRLLTSVDVLVVPSTCPESFGIAAREAHLAGRPVLTTDRGALPESVRDGVDGLLVPAEDPPAMASAIRRLATDRALLERLLAGAASARARVKSMDRYAEEIDRALYAPA
jgi:glycosyltransferase involved in cell wall biosynthesis